MSASCGATHPMVGMRCSATSRRASSGRQRAMTCSVAPSRRYQGSFPVMPMCANCVDASIGEPPSQVVSASGPRSIRWIARSCRSRYRAAFARPVVPEVKQIAAGRSSSGAGSGTDAPTTASSAPRRPAASTTMVARSGRPSISVGSASTNRGETDRDQLAALGGR